MNAPLMLRPNKPLTRREEQVFSLLGQGKSNKLIARELNVAYGTAKIHVHAVMKKLNVRHRSEIFGAKSMSDRSILIRAAELIEHEAEILRECHTTAPAHDDWDADDAVVKANHDEMVSVAGELRRMAGS